MWDLWFCKGLCIICKQLSGDAEDSAEEEPAAAKPPRAGVKRTRAAAKHAGDPACATLPQTDCTAFVIAYVCAVHTYAHTPIYIQVHVHVHVHIYIHIDTCVYVHAYSICQQRPSRGRAESVNILS